MYRSRSFVLACFIAAAAPLAYLCFPRAHGLQKAPYPSPAELARLPRLGQGHGPDRHFEVEPLMAVPLRGHGGLDVHFRATHFNGMPEPPHRYQLLIMISRMESQDPIQTHAFDPYVMDPDEQRQDEFSHRFELPPGDYGVDYELRSLYPVYSQDGKKLSDFAICQRMGWWAEVD